MEIKSEVLKKLKPSIDKAVEIIKSHIKNKNPILIRHHADQDGYCGGFILEKAIYPLILKAHTREREAWYTYTRRPCLTPFYAYEDANKDLAYFLSDRGKYEYKKPLVIIIDNGSSEQDLMAIKKLKIYDVKVLVIDHHPPSEKINKIVDVHVNPHDVGSNYDFSAGMLSCEIAKIINPKLTTGFIGAVSAYADKVKSDEADQFFKLANKEGYTDEFIKKAAKSLDYETFSFGYADTKKLLEDFFGKDKEKQKKIINMLYDEVEMRRAKTLSTALRYSHVSRTPKQNIVIIPMAQITQRGDYPTAGKVVGITHDYYAKKEKKPTVSLGFSDSMITLRATPDTNIDVNKIIKSARMKFLHAQVEGGGHAKAGSIRFIPAASEEMKNFVLQKIKG